MFYNWKNIAQLDEQRIEMQLAKNGKITVKEFCSIVGLDAKQFEKNIQKYNKKQQKEIKRWKRKWNLKD